MRVEELVGVVVLMLLGVGVTVEEELLGLLLKFLLLM